MSSTTFSKTKAELIAAGLATDHSFCGCSPEELDAIESRFSIRLPSVYRQFMLEMGRGAGDFLVGMDYVFPQLLQFREWAEELLKQAGSSFTLPTNAYVFLSVPSGAFFFLYCDNNPDPPVFVFVETEQQPRRLDSSFSEWLYATAEEQIGMRQVREEFKRAGEEERRGKKGVR